MRQPLVPPRGYRRGPNHSIQTSVHEMEKVKSERMKKKLGLLSRSKSECKESEEEKQKEEKTKESPTGKVKEPKTSKVKPNKRQSTVPTPQMMKAGSSKDDRCEPGASTSFHPRSQSTSVIPHK